MKGVATMMRERVDDLLRPFGSRLSIADPSELAESGRASGFWLGRPADILVVTAQANDEWPSLYERRRHAPCPPCAELLAIDDSDAGAVLISAQPPGESLADLPLPDSFDEWRREAQAVAQAIDRLHGYRLAHGDLSDDLAFMHDGVAWLRAVPFAWRSSRMARSPRDRDLAYFRALCVRRAKRTTTLTDAAGQLLERWNVGTDDTEGATACGLLRALDAAIAAPAPKRAESPCVVEPNEPAAPAALDDMASVPPWIDPKRRLRKRWAIGLTIVLVVGVLVTMYGKRFTSGRSIRALLGWPDANAGAKTGPIDSPIAGRSRPYDPLATLTNRYGEIESSFRRWRRSVEPKIQGFFREAFRNASVPFDLIARRFRNSKDPARPKYLFLILTEYPYDQSSRLLRDTLIDANGVPKHELFDLLAACPCPQALAFLNEIVPGLIERRDDSDSLVGVIKALICMRQIRQVAPDDLLAELAIDDQTRDELRVRLATKLLGNRFDTVGDDGRWTIPDPWNSAALRWTETVPDAYLESILRSRDAAPDRSMRLRIASSVLTLLDIPDEAERLRVAENLLSRIRPEWAAERPIFMASIALVLAASGSERCERYLADSLGKEGWSTGLTIWDAMTVGCGLAPRSDRRLLQESVEHPHFAIRYRARESLAVRQRDFAALNGTKVNGLDVGMANHTMLLRLIGRESTRTIRFDPSRPDSDNAMDPSVEREAFGRTRVTRHWIGIGANAGPDCPPLMLRYLCVRTFGERRHKETVAYLELLRRDPSVLVQHAAAIAFLKTASIPELAALDEVLDNPRLDGRVRAVLQMGRDHR